MKENLEKIFSLISEINEKYNQDLVDSEKMKDVEENVIENLDTDFHYLKEAMESLKNIDVTKEKLSTDEAYIKSIAYLNLALLDISNDCKDLYDILGEMNQNLLKKDVK